MPEFIDRQTIRVNRHGISMDFEDAMRSRTEQRDVATRSGQDDWLVQMRMGGAE